MPDDGNNDDYERKQLWPLLDLGFAAGKNIAKGSWWKTSTNRMLKHSTLAQALFTSIYKVVLVWVNAPFTGILLMCNLVHNWNKSQQQQQLLNWVSLEKFLSVPT